MTVLPDDEADDWLLVSEIFRSHQGEGRSCGEIATFIRLGGCNLHCSWCDTPYTWVFVERQRQQHQGHTLYSPALELRRQTFPQVAEKLDPLAQLIVITGGEPLLQAGRVAKFIELVNEWNPVLRRFEIETAGTMPPLGTACVDAENVRFNVSLKLASSGNEPGKRLVPVVVRVFASQSETIFKFVITRNYFDDDIREVQEIADQFHIAPQRIWLMPEGTSSLSQMSGMQLLMPVALSLGYNVTTRLHILGYDNQRGI